MSYLVPSEFVTKMVDAGESKIFMSTRDTVIRAYMAGAILALAAWFRRVRGVDDAGRAVRVVHPLADLLKRKAEDGGADPAALLSIQALFGDLGSDRRVVEPLASWLGRLYGDGIQATLDHACRRAGVS